jgi:ferritin-like metal-binding protein YciE
VPGHGGLIEEGKEFLEGGIEPAVMDAALIAAVQKVENYEIASYGSARTWAQEVGQSEPKAFHPPARR